MSEVPLYVSCGSLWCDPSKREFCIFSPAQGCVYRGFLAHKKTHPPTTLHALKACA